MDNKNQKPSNYTGVNRLFRSGFIEGLKERRREGTFHELFDDWRWIFSYSKRYKGIIILYTLLGIIGTTFGLVSAVISKYMIDIVINREKENLWLLALGMIGSMVFSMVFSSLVSRFSAKIRVYVNNDIQADIFDKIMDTDWSHVTGYANGDLLNRFSKDVETVSTNAVSWIPTVIIDLYSFVATFVVILHYDVTMAFIALLSAPGLVIASRFMVRRMAHYRKRLREVSSDLMSFETEVFYHMDTIKSFGIMDLYGDKMRSVQEKYRDASLESNAFDIKARIYTRLLGYMVATVAFVYCLVRLWSGAITYGTMTLFLQQRASLTGHFNSLVNILPNMLDSSVSAGRIRELTDLPREKHDPEVTKEMQAVSKNGFTVLVENVAFSYDSREQIVHGGYLRADPGEIVAMVGPSGEGKTTMIRLLLGLVNPEEGSVRLLPASETDQAAPGQENGAAGTAEMVSRQSEDGGSAAQTAPNQHEGWEMNADVRRFFSYVPQGNSILAGTVEENLRMVKEDATEQEMEEALRAACAWEFVSNLPDGMQTVVGERGHGLSEGQAQRIAIARALLRGAPVLLLDEATSALDIKTEKQVLQNILDKDPHRTILLTTHRPAVLEMCSRIYHVTEGTLKVEAENA